MGFCIKHNKKTEAGRCLQCVADSPGERIKVMEKKMIKADAIVEYTEHKVKKLEKKLEEAEAHVLALKVELL